MFSLQKQKKKKIENFEIFEKNKNLKYQLHNFVIFDIGNAKDPFRIPPK